MGQPKKTDAKDQWLYEPERPISDELIEDMKSAADDQDLPPEDFIYFIIADLILAELHARKVLRFGWRIKRVSLIPIIMEKLSLLDYGKELVNGGQKMGQRNDKRQGN